MKAGPPHPVTPAPAAVPGESSRAGAAKTGAANTARRRLRTVLTVALAIAGLGAWAVALVQPWAGRSGDPGVVTVPAAELNEDWIRAVSSEGEWVPERHKPEVQALARNPFLSEALADEVPRLPEAPPAASAPAKPEPQAAKTSTPTTRAATPNEILAVVKNLRLEVTLLAPDGDRWAVINGQDYRVGDKVSGLRIAEIEEGKVKLEQGGVVCVLRMD